MAVKLKIGGVYCERGTHTLVELPLAKLYDSTDVSIPVKVIRGEKKGPTLLLSAGLHGDEVVGVEAVRRLIRHPVMRKVRGTVILVPIVNIYGFNNRSRYLPDRRDLNRCFPGSRSGSLASRLAYTFMKQLVSKATHGIDFHSGAIHRNNLPHIRAFLDDRKTKRLAKAFGVPVIVDSPLRDGSLRAAAVDRGIPMLVFEGGEALRFDEKVIRAAIHGTLSVMVALGMLENDAVKKTAQVQTFEARSSQWQRAPESGIVQLKKKLGAQVKKGDVLAVIGDPLGQRFMEMESAYTGHIIGVNNLPLVNRGDALYHIATFDNLKEIRDSMEEFEEYLVETAGGA